jgi:glutathione S-transferase/RNA polymerase-associated protein
MLEEAMDTHFEAITWGMSEIRNFGRASGALAETMLARAGEQIAGWYQWLDSQLGDRPWFNGDTFGWGDLCVVPFVSRAVGFDSAAVSLDAVRQAMEQGLFKREYRDHRLEWMVKTGGIEVVLKGLEKGNIRFIDPFPA